MTTEPAQPSVTQSSVTQPSAGRTVLLLHPGAMGSALGAALVGAGHRVLWVPAGRSPVTRARAEAAGLAAGDLEPALRQASVVLCSCAPQGALELARQVGALGFAGTYVDANPLSPAALAAAAEAVASGGGQMVDAGVVGPPPAGRRATQLFLAGPSATVEPVRALWEGTDVTAVPVGEQLGAASAAKSAFALYNKGRQALAVVAQQLAERYGVGAALREQAGRRDAAVLGEPRLAEELAAVAWRWGPEFDELAETLASAGLDPDLARALRRVWTALERQ